MRKMILLIAVSAFTFSCDNKIESDPVISKEDMQSIDESGMNTVEEKKFEGDFSGEIKGKKIQLTLNSDTYKLNIDGKKYEGKFYLVDDGNQIELEGAPLPYYNYESAERLLVLNEDGSFPEKDVFLKK